MTALVQHSVLAAGSTDGVAQVGMLALVTLPLLAYVLLVLGALISIVGSGLDLGMKLVWVVLVFVAPFIGSLLWFFIGRGHARRTHVHHTYVH